MRHPHRPPRAPEEFGQQSALHPLRLSDPALHLPQGVPDFLQPGNRQRFPAGGHRLADHPLHPVRHRRADLQTFAVDRIGESVAHLFQCRQPDHPLGDQCAGPPVGHLFQRLRPCPALLPVDPWALSGPGDERLRLEGNLHQLQPDCRLCRTGGVPHPSDPSRLGDQGPGKHVRGRRSDFDADDRHGLGRHELERGTLLQTDLPDGGIEDGRPAVQSGESVSYFPNDTLCSMNLWGYPLEFLTALQEDFPAFLSGLPEGDLSTEYLLPTIVGGLIQQKKADVAVLPTGDHWFGITYQEDKASTCAAFRRLVEEGCYPADLTK